VIVPSGSTMHGSGGMQLGSVGSLHGGGGHAGWLGPPHGGGGWQLGSIGSLHGAGHVVVPSAATVQGSGGGMQFGSVGSMHGTGSSPPGTQPGTLGSHMLESPIAPTSNGAVGTQTLNASPVQPSW
jgi:hypothetical protein